MRAFFALAVSVGIHLLIAVGLAVGHSRGTSPDELARLDLTAVELSFAEKVDDSEELASLPSPALSQPDREKPKPDTPPLERVPKMTTPQPPEPDDRPRLREPEEAVARLPEPPPPSPPPQAASAPSPAAAPRQAHVDAPPRPRRTIKPEYPKGARQRGEQGPVRVEITVDADGCVSDARVVETCGFPELDQAALKAAREARFVPAKVGGEPVASTAQLTLQFKLK